ncbi:MAG: transglycosylase SLT domain-containing protein [Acidobacteria bacterium]|nr:transglycosylase SLT domain-containing protein [Acidobacteriota bacterium]
MRTVVALFAVFLFPVLFAGGTLAETDFDLSAVADRFPHQSLEARIAFWKMVYSECDRREVVLHDRLNLALIYNVLKFERVPEASLEEAEKQRSKIEEEMGKIRKALQDFATLGMEAAGLSAAHRKVYEALEKAALPLNPSLLRDAAGRVREQRGIKDRFEQGIVRSGLYLPYIKRIFQERGLPEELAYLPHVESSFDYAAYSKVRAAGIWQFMRGTARGLLTMNSVLDERRDPVRSTKAAASVLLKSYQLLGSWPLAITSYNHGINGMLRAKAIYGNDYLAILERYDGKLFGFASQNFYSEFLAALEVAKNYRKYFPLASVAEPLNFEQLILTRGSRTQQLASIDQIPGGVLRAYNPGVLVDIKRNFHRLPSGYALRLPDGVVSPVFAALGPEEAIWASNSSRGSTPPKYRGRPRQYRVRRGDTLTKIAALFRVSLKALQQKNKSLKSGQIFADQVILLP